MRVSAYGEFGLGLLDLFGDIDDIRGCADRGIDLGAEARADTADLHLAVGRRDNDIAATLRQTKSSVTPSCFATSFISSVTTPYVWHLQRYSYHTGCSKDQIKARFFDS